MINLHEGEVVIMERRRYWLPFAMESLVLLCIALLPIYFLAAADPGVGRLGILFAQERNLLFFLAAGWVLAVWIIFFSAWTNYYLDVLVVTNKRAIDIEQLGLFSRDMAELRIENIQDIKVEVFGILASLLHFGNIRIQTAGESEEFIINNIHNPHEVKDAIAKQHDALIKNKQA